MLAAANRIAATRRSGRGSEVSLSMYARIISPGPVRPAAPHSATHRTLPRPARRSDLPSLVGDTAQPMFAGGRSGSGQYLPGGGQRARPAGLGFGAGPAPNPDPGAPQHDLRDRAVTTVS